MIDSADTATLNDHVTVATSAFSNKGYFDLAAIRVETIVNSSNNDIRVVITNEGGQTARISQLEPVLSMTARGVFNFSRLLTDGRLILEPGQSVHVSMTPRGLLPEATSPAYLSASILSSQLRQSFNVITVELAFGEVQVLEDVRLV